jgi:hypothetical protein
MKTQLDNPESFWEGQPFIQFNEALLKSADRSWQDSRPIDLKWFKDPSKRLHRIEQAKKLIAQEFPKGNLLVLKDPRICRLLPIWLTALEQSDIDVTVLLISRNPLEVAASLEARNQINLTQSNLLWLEHMLPAEKQTRHLPRAFVGFDELLEDWRSVLIDSFDDLGIEPIDLTSNSADEIDLFLAKDRKNFHVNTDYLLKDKSISPLLKKSWVAFQSKPISSKSIFDDLNQEYENLRMNLGNSQDIVMKQENLSAEESPNLSKSEDHRHIVLHYHLFKNAGTSLDKILKENFKEGWHEHEGPSSGWKSTDVAAYLEQNKHITVLSSHTALLPVPELPNTTIYPVIFIRHPIDRIRSIYEFERKQIAETEGAIKAKELDLAGYIKWRLSRKGDRSIRNFHAYRLAFACPQVHSGKKLTEEERALMAISDLPFLGIVEEFDNSLKKLEGLLRPFSQDLSFRSIKLNSTQKEGTSIEGRLYGLESEIGSQLYSELLKCNELDLKIHKLIT